MKLVPFALSGLLALTGCSKQEEEPVAGHSSTNDHSPGNPLTAPTDYLGAVAQGQSQAKLTINLTSVQQAINLHHAAEGSYPETLAQLVQEGYLASVPAAPAGQKLVYDATNGTITLEPIPTK